MSSRNQKVRGLLRFATGLCGAALVLVACQSSPRQLAAAMPECPRDSVRIWKDSVPGVAREFTSTKQLAIAGATTLVPEFNDCQRFRQKSGDAYGPLIGIFARESLSYHISRMLDSARANAQIRAVSIGLIYDWDSPYPALDIASGFNCLYMWAENGSLKRKAAMVPVAADSVCRKDLAVTDIPASTPPLEVFPRRPDPIFTAANHDYPDVARWDWDEVLNTEYIGIGCQDSWCEIAKPPLHESRKHDDLAATSPHGRRVFQIKGWYDEQLLAVSTTPGGSLLKASTVTGTIFPGPELGSLPESAYQKKWVDTAATTLLTGHLANYVSKLNFEEPPLVGGHQFNVIALCEGSRADCGVPLTVPPKTCSKPGDPWYGDDWWARITSTKGAVAYRCVIRRKHPELNKIIPGLVRWRWSLDDEVTWIACPDGCCEVTGEP